MRGPGELPCLQLAGPPTSLAGPEDKLFAGQEELFLTQKVGLLTSCWGQGHHFYQAHVFLEQTIQGSESLEPTSQMWTVRGHFCATVAESGHCSRGYVVPKGRHIYYLAL